MVVGWLVVAVPALDLVYSLPGKVQAPPFRLPRLFPLSPIVVLSPLVNRPPRPVRRAQSYHEGVSMNEHRRLWLTPLMAIAPDGDPLPHRYYFGGFCGRFRKGPLSQSA